MSPSSMARAVMYGRLWSAVSPVPRAPFLPVAPGVKVHLAVGYVDMRKGIDGLAMLVQGVLRQDPFTGHLFVFRGAHPG
jgi:transposase